MEQSEARQQERHKANELRMDRAEERQEERHVAIDARLRVVEQKAAIAGAVSGSAVSVGVARHRRAEAVAGPRRHGSVMAHAQEKRTQLRGLYIYQRLPMEAACKKVGVPRSTANRWKSEALEKGDDWDTVRAAVALGDDNFASLSKKLLEDYLVQHQATMDQLREATGMSARDRAETLASMSDSFNKTMASFKEIGAGLGPPGRADRRAAALRHVRAGTLPAAPAGGR